ncbi:TPR repeat-containing thioredoxin TTL4-like [Hibiscus syriacus]|uniref:TPR repeat-containing thioredoxin TTL4-like n=1 Tax=Hibiscus syriacus TaxID=106335 RepID=A0A6A3B8P9_HIBSY|nr:TPR repeat-containing thioredoxin TTL4-like [Hibiscus syriacus]
MADLALVVPDTSDAIVETSLAIGQEFPNVETCRRTLKDIATAMHFDLRIVKSDRSRFIAKCSKEGCPWRVHVAKCPGVPTFTLRTLQGEHTCEVVRNLHHQQASVGWVARSVEARIWDNPLYKSKDILQDIRDQHGVAVSYMQAWRGKERSMAAVYGTFEEGYHLLPAYCEQIRKTNPGSVASVFATRQENCSQRLFISYRASIYGFINACRPLLELDKADLKGKYLGSLLCAEAVDADDALFPLAIVIVDVENDENWMWFVSELRKLLGVNIENMLRLTILSERRRSIVDAVECFSWFLSTLCQ